MNDRRRFLKLAAGASVPAAAVFTVSAQAQQSGDNQIVGAWQTTHSLPFPPFSFREFLTFQFGGGLHETNSFLHTASNLDLSPYGLPSVLNASDGAGNWERSGQDMTVVFRKMLFDGSRRNFADLKVSGVVRVSGGAFQAQWQINVVDLEDRLILPFGPATSNGKRIA
ncbi:MAG: hypothetical protein ABJF23_07815 [Bryobacteraceae bacterium]